VTTEPGVVLSETDALALRSRAIRLYESHEALRERVNDWAETAATMGDEAKRLREQVQKLAEQVAELERALDGWRDGD
jgi:hypothetical protein